jgi:hypothetical protein
LDGGAAVVQQIFLIFFDGLFYSVVQDLFWGGVLETEGAFYHFVAFA